MTDHPYPEASVEELPAYDAIIVGVPTRYGNMSSQMQAFWASQADASSSVTAEGKAQSKQDGHQQRLREQFKKSVQALFENLSGAIETSLRSISEEDRPQSDASPHLLLAACAASIASSKPMMSLTASGEMDTTFASAIEALRERFLRLANDCLAPWTQQQAQAAAAIHTGRLELLQAEEEEESQLPGPTEGMIEALHFLSSACVQAGPALNGEEVRGRLLESITESTIRDSRVPMGDLQMLEALLLEPGAESATLKALQAALKEDKSGEKLTAEVLHNVRAQLSLVLGGLSSANQQGTASTKANETTAQSSYEFCRVSQPRGARLRKIAL